MWQDWVKLSRKHAIDVNEVDQHLSIFGGKLTDCINVGNEVADIVARLGIDIPYADKIWYGESGDAARNEFLHQAELMDLDSMTDPSSSEPLSQRLWRRYGASAMEMLQAIRADPCCAKLLIENAEYLRCELEQSARREMITKLDDFLRRRSKIALVVPREDIIAAPGLKEACKILFGDQADARLREYIETTARGNTANTVENTYNLLLLSQRDYNVSYNLYKTKVTKGISVICLVPWSSNRWPNLCWRLRPGMIFRN